MAQLKITFEQRRRAVEALKRGLTVDQAVKALATRHPNVDAAAVRAAYFPPNGVFAIHTLQGKSPVEIEERWRKMQRYNVKYTSEQWRDARRRITSNLSPSARHSLKTSGLQLHALPRVWDQLSPVQRYLLNQREMGPRRGWGLVAMGNGEALSEAGQRIEIESALAIARETIRKKRRRQ